MAPSVSPFLTVYHVPQTGAGVPPPPPGGTTIAPPLLAGGTTTTPPVPVGPYGQPSTWMTSKFTSSSRYGVPHFFRPWIARMIELLGATNFAVYCCIGPGDVRR